MTNKTYQLETLTCPTCALKIQTMLSRTNGVMKAEVFFTSSRIKIEFDESVILNDELKMKIEKFGYQIINEK
jgi:copper chaperone CopZ